MEQTMFCLVLSTACFLAMVGMSIFIRQNFKHNKHLKAKRANKLTEFSKKTIIALVAMWFIGAVIGIAVVILQVYRNDYSTGLSDLLLYIGAPMTGGIVAYLLKSAYENREKIRKNEVQNYAEYEDEIDKP